MDDIEERDLVEQLSQLVDERLLAPLELLLESSSAVDSLRRWVDRLATSWAGDLLGADDDRAAATTARLVHTLYAGGSAFRPTPEWWQTPLGRVVARRVGHPVTEHVSYAVAGGMLGITRQAVHDLVSRGKLDRHPDGGVWSRSVRKRVSGETQAVQRNALT